MAHSTAPSPQADLSQGPGGYRWFAKGDINGLFGLLFDNMAVLAFMAFILIGIFEFPREIVLEKMIPGTAFGVLFGDLVYTWMAFRLAKRTGNRTVTAMPLGLDTPSTIGIAFTVLGPGFVAFKARGMAVPDAAMATWYLGMASMILIGVIKLGFSFVGPWIQTVVPRAGLLGSLAGIGLALIGFLPLVEIFSTPVVGMVALGLVIYAVMAGLRLPWGFPGVLASVLVGTAIYYGMAHFGVLGFEPAAAPKLELAVALPLPTLDFIHGLKDALAYLPIAFPFAILTVIGGINVTESARAAGDDFNTRDILLTEAVATLLAGVCGGVAQSTPYIGQPAYKAMGCRAGYTLMTGLIFGIGGMLGVIGFLVDAIPRAAVAPILIFVALDIMAQAYYACPQRHGAAVGLAYLPSVARMLAIKMGPFITPAMLAASGPHLPEALVIVALGNGFILTGMLWGAMVASVVDRKFIAAAIYSAICAVFTLFGIIHSAVLEGSMYLPWHLEGTAQQIPYQFGAGYAVLAVMFLLLGMTKASRAESVAHVYRALHGVV